MGTESNYKRTLAGSVGAGVGAIFSASGRTYYIIEHKTTTAYHNAGDYDKNASNLLKKFFNKTDEKIISAEYLNKSDIKVVTKKDGKRETFIFNLDKGQILSDKSWKKYFV